LLFPTRRIFMISMAEVYTRIHEGLRRIRAGPVRARGAPARTIDLHVRMGDLATLDDAPQDLATGGFCRRAR